MTGLTNIGNTCYLNATLQCLVHIHELNMFLDKHIPTSVLLKEYNDLRLLMLQNHQSITPTRFVKVVHHVCNEKKMDLFTSYSQYDLSEFLRFMMNEFHESMKQYVQVPIPKQMTLIDKKCVEMMIRNYSKDYSFIIDFFYGISVNIIETTKIESIIPESFFILDLPIPSTSVVTLYDCIQLYAQPETIEWKDESTNTYVPATKKIQFWKLPRLLFVVFKRFDNTNHKNNQMIQVPFTITLGSESFQLICICNHYGSVHGGHYSTLVQQDKWIEFDDGTMTIVPEDKVITQNAYCLLFRKN
jgi:ubiquitin carboxyl-terminal hydrolase 8